MSYVVTARLDPASFASLDEFRKKYFPPERNFLSAHVTLFHQAPPEILSAVPPSFPLMIEFQESFFMGHGFGIRTKCDELSRWKKNCLNHPWEFTSQDRNNSRLHVTIQNKVSPEQAREDFRNFSGTWKPFAGSISGIDVWIYRNGPWEFFRSL